MKKETVMICLENLGIGGVETAVINQAIALLNKNINVIILAKEGIYTKKLLEIGAKCINWNFELENRIDSNKISQISNIIKDNNVTQVIINQFPCINNVIFACFLNNIPYIAYVHSTYKAFENENVNSNVYEYFTYNYPIFKQLLPMFFNMARRIVTITSVSKEYIMNKYNIEEEKILVIPNSIDFNSFFSTSQINNITVFLLISRFSEEKLDSIKQALNFFHILSDKYHDKNYILKIIGTGNKEDEVNKSIKKFNLEGKVQMLGEVTNVRDYIQESDCVIGIDRCLLEAIAMKRLAIISGYDGLKGIVNSDNIAICINENFSGRLLDNIDFEGLADYIHNLTVKEACNIINKNYDISKEKLDINNNIYFFQIDGEYNIDILNVVTELLKLLECSYNIIEVEKEKNNNMQKKYEELENKHNYIIEDDKKIIDDKENIIKEKQSEINRLNLELQTIYSSRSYIYYKKIKKLFYRNKK